MAYLLFIIGGETNEKTEATTISIKHGMEMLASHGGLIHIGELIEAVNSKQRMKKIPGVHCVNPKMSHASILPSMFALINGGKPDYDAIEIFRQKREFFTKAMWLEACTSSPTIVASDVMAIFRLRIQGLIYYM